MTAGAASYAGRPVLITGGTGFLGSNLVAALRRQQAEVAILGRSPLPEGGELGSLLAGARHFQGDLRDGALVGDAVAGRDVIFNLAGHSGSTNSNEEPLEDLDVNLRGQLTLLESCRRLKTPPAVVFASSRLVYRPAESLPVAESAPTGPLSLYGVHKLAGESYHLLYRHLYGLRSAVLRITNPYGHFQKEGQNRYGIINWFIELAVAGRPLPVYGDGHQLRDYLHVDDVARALLAAGSDPRADGQVFNVGSGAGVSFKRMAELVIREAGGGEVQHLSWPPDAARVETGDFVADVSRIKEVIGWTPLTPLDEGLRGVVEQYRRLRPRAG